MPPNDVDAALDIAIAAVGKAHKDSLTHQLIDYLMGEIDGVPKAARLVLLLTRNLIVASSSST